MLILARKIGESILIEPGIEIVLLSITKNQVCRLGILAPKEITVLRKELLDKQPNKEIKRIRHGTQFNLSGN